MLDDEAREDWVLKNLVPLTCIDFDVVGR